MITIVGAGSWGTALAIHLARNGTPVRLCARSTEVVEAMRLRRRRALLSDGLAHDRHVELGDRALDCRYVARRNAMPFA